MKEAHNISEASLGLSDEIEAEREDYLLRPVKGDDDKFHAYDAFGHGHYLAFDTAWEVEVWMMGYDCGASENM